MASLDNGQERLYAAMARALVCQAAGDYLGMADALALGTTRPWTAAGHGGAVAAARRLYSLPGSLHNRAIGAPHHAEPSRS